MKESYIHLSGLDTFVLEQTEIITDFLIQLASPSEECTLQDVVLAVPELCPQTLSCSQEQLEPYEIDQKRALSTHDHDKIKEIYGIVEDNIHELLSLLIDPERVLNLAQIKDEKMSESEKAMHQDELLREGYELCYKLLDVLSPSAVPGYYYLV